MGSFHEVHPAFRATGKGLANNLPNVVATAKNANAVLINNALAKNHKNYKLYLFCTAVHTGYKVHGSYGQSVSSRAYYPRSFSQDNLAIRCVVANQYEYDRVVEFVQAHQASVINATGQGAHGGVPVEFKLFEHKIPVGRDRKGKTLYKKMYDAMHMEGLIPDFQAGHARFVHAPVFDIPLIVTNDYLQKNEVQTALLNHDLQYAYLEGFGKRIIPPMPYDLRAAIDFVDSVSDFASDAVSAATNLGQNIQDFWETHL
jgi:hypothetical protein